MANLDDGTKLPMAFQQSLFQALLKNNKLHAYWSERQTVYQELEQNLSFYVDKLKHEIYAPVGKKAFMKGTIVHTNDVTVAIGCGYFLKVSSSGAKEICARRLKEIDQVIHKLGQERLLLESKINLPAQVEAFGDSERREIIEPYDEKEEKKWREKHQHKIREHKKELAKIRDQIQSNKLDTEDDHMKHLDLLEMQEELEEEIDRLGGESSESEISEEDDTSEQEGVEEIKEEIKPVKIEKKVRFDLEDSVKEILTDEPTAIADDIKETIPKQIESEAKRPISKFKASRFKNCK